MQGVLVPLDGSGACERIVQPILDHLSPLTHHLLLLRVRSPSEFAAATVPEARHGEELEPRFPTMAQAIRSLGVTEIPMDEEAANARVEQELYPTRRRLESAGFKVETLVTIGDAAKEIERIVAQREISLIAMTTHGRSGLPRLLMGSVAEHVVRHVQAPVLLLRSS